MTDTSISKWEKAIIRLVELTQDEKLEWKIVNPKEYVPKEDTRGAMLLVKHKTKHLLLYRTAYVRKDTSNIMAVFAGTAKEIKEYRPDLCIYDVPTKMIVYTFPYSELTEDLYQAATFKAAEVEDFLKDLLEDDAT